MKAEVLYNGKEDRKRPVLIKVLGPIEVIVQGRIIPLTGQRQRALLAALALEHGKAVAVDWLMEALWHTTPPPTARAKIQSHVSGLRHAISRNGGGLQSPLLTKAPGYVLSSEGVELDLAAFEALTAQAEEALVAGRNNSASELLANALALWRGRAFADVESQLIRSASEKLEQRRLLGIEIKAEADLALGYCDRVVAELGPWLAAHPFRERMRALLILALYRVGCRADALDLYRCGHKLMVSELGLEPGPQLRELQRRILTDDPALLANGRLASEYRLSHHAPRTDCL